LDYISQKIEKIAYTRNGKDILNIQIGITSFLYKISAQFLRAWGFSGSAISNMLSKFSREPR